MNTTLPLLQNMRAYFASGITQENAFRKKALENLQQAIVFYEPDIMEALYTDLKKSAEETWVTEIGFLLAEIRHALNYLQQWMKRTRVPTNFLNFPAKSYIYKEPLGVVLIIGPWNYPLQLLLAPLVGAIAAGNCAVLKPSELAPATAAVTAKIIAKAFEPSHVLLVKGPGDAIVPTLMNDFTFDHVFYTGSTGVGKLIYAMAAEKLMPVTLELGGKSPCVVEADADIKVTARRIAMTKFSNAGQMCVAPDYLLVHASVKDELINALKESIERFFTTDAASSYNYGKIINQKNFNRLVNSLQSDKILYGGSHDAATLFIGPTLLEVSEDAVLMQEEIFGPLLPVIPFTHFEEAKAIINRHPNPLAFYVFTKSKIKEAQWLKGIAFGGGCVNNAAWHLTNFNLPFGGRGNSGMGAYHGKFSFDTFSHKKAVMKTPLWFDPDIKYPPFKGKLNLFKRFIR